MTRYFLTRVRIEGFRGINNAGEPLELKFRGDAVNSVFAVNGTGKSSIFEALFYAVRDNIPKLDALYAAEKPEQYYVNKFHPNGIATIELELTTDGSTPETVSLSITRDASGNRTVTSPSGHPDPEGLLHSLDEVFALLDYQSFNKFIEESPLHRGRSFSALLGLEAYSHFRQALQAVADTRTVNTDFDIQAEGVRAETLETNTRSALRRLETAYQSLVGKPLLDVHRLDEYSKDAFEALAAIPLLEPHFAGNTLLQVDFDAAIRSIKSSEGGEERQELSRVIQTIAQLDDLGEPNGAIEAEQQRLSGLVDELVTLLKATRGERCKHLYEAASAVVEHGDWTNLNVCPLCDSALETSIEDIVAHQLGQYEAVSTKAGELVTAWNSQSFFKRLRELEQSTVMAIPEAEGIAANMSRMVNSGSVRQEDLDRAKIRLAALEERRVKLVGEFRTRKTKLEEKLPPSLVALTEQVETGRRFSAALEDYGTGTQKLAETNRHLDSRRRWAKFISAAATAFAEAEAKMTTEKIGSISADYKAMFTDLMFVKDVIPELRREDRREDLHVVLSEFHGLKDLSARALLSESFRNALAISVFLSAALRHTGAPRFIVLDDVTSSFDSGHQLNLMELIRTKLQNGARPDGLQFIVFSHDGQLEKYFDRLDNEGDWNHQRLQGSPPLGAVMSQAQDANRLRGKASTFLDAGQIQEAQPLIRQYLEFKLLQVIRKVSIPVPIDFAMKDHNRMVSNCIDAISAAVKLHQNASMLILEPQQVSAISSTHVPALIGNWVNHYETASGSSITAAMLKSVLQTIDDFADCFRYDETTPTGATQRRYYKSLSAKW